ncbi:hypothetical protein GQX74_000940 [Glossina fuscipes]|nr:hypothetical protein GQX74_000940 [Glossina fuscipes]
MTRHLHFGVLMSMICPLIKIKEKTKCLANKLTSEVYWAISIIRDKEYSNLPSTKRRIESDASLINSVHGEDFTPVVAIATESYCIVPQKSNVMLAASNPFLLCRYFFAVMRTYILSFAVRLCGNFHYNFATLTPLTGTTGGHQKLGNHSRKESGLQGVYLSQSSRALYVSLSSISCKDFSLFFISSSTRRISRKAVAT